MKYKVNEEGVEALHRCSESLKESIEELENASILLRTILSGNSDGAGPHADEIEEIADEIIQTAERIKEPVDETCSGLEELADNYEDIISQDLS